MVRWLVDGARQVLALGLLLIMLSIPSTMMPVLASSNHTGSLIFAEFLVRGRDIPQIIGARSSSLRVAVYHDGEWVEGTIYVVPSIVKTFIAPLNQTMKTLLVDGSIGEDTLLYIRVPTIIGEESDEWGLEFVKCRLHERIYVKARLPCGEVGFYIYYDKNSTTSNLPYDPYWTLEEISKIRKLTLIQSSSITVVSREEHSSFALDSTLSMELGYDIEPSSRQLEVEPLIVIDGGGGGGPTEVGQLVYSIDLTMGSSPIKKAYPNTWTSTNRYLGYEVAFAELVFKATASQEPECLHVHVEVYYNDTGQLYASKDSYYSVSTTPKHYSMSLADIIPYTSNRPISLKIEFKSYVDEVIVYPILYLKKLVYGSRPPELKWFNDSLVNFWYKPRNAWFESDTITFYGVSAVPGTFLNSTSTSIPVGLKIDLTHWDSRSSAPFQKRIDIYFNSVRVCYASVQGKPHSGGGRTYSLSTLIPIDSDTAYLIVSSLKYNRSITVSIEIPGVNESYSTLTIRDLRIIGEYMPEVWRSGSESFIAEHTLARCQQMVYTENYAQSTLLGEATLTIGGSDYGRLLTGQPINNLNAYFETVASGREVEGGYVTRIWDVTMDIRVPLPQGSDFDPPPSHNEAVEDQANEWLTQAVMLVEEIYQYISIGLLAEGILGYSASPPVSIGLSIAGHLIDLTKKTCLSQATISWSVEGGTLIIHYHYDAGVQPVKYGRFRVKIEYSFGNCPAGTILSIPVDAWVNFNNGAASTGVHVLIYVKTPDKLPEYYAIYGLHG